MPTGNNGISLREYVDIILRHQSRLHKQRLDAMNMALKLQAKEYERRLELLNHAHQQAVETLNTYVPRELWHEQHKALEEKIVNLETRVTMLFEARAKMMGGYWVVTAVAAVIGFMASQLSSWFHR